MENKTYHLYSDGNSFPRAKRSGFGGYLEAPDGSIVLEYSEEIKDSQNYHDFELLGIIRGLKIAADKKIPNIVSHCDHKTTILKLKHIFETQQFHEPGHLKADLVKEIVDISKNFESIVFEYVPREKNKYADLLSRKYAKLLEKNFLTHYQNDLNHSERMFKENDNSNSRIFFSHPSMVRTIHKNNPYMVAPDRNRKVRKISKAEDRNVYHFIYVEFNPKDDCNQYKVTIYDKDKKIVSTNMMEFTKKELFFMHDKKFVDWELKVDNQSKLEDIIITSQQAKVLIDTIEKLKKENHDVSSLWIDSNNSIFTNQVEQRTKIHHFNWSDFKSLYNELNDFKRIFFHHFTFEHKLSDELLEKEEQKSKIDNEIVTIETLIDKVFQSSSTKDINKNFGNVIRHQLRHYTELLEQELNEIEKRTIIEQTIAVLEQKGFDQIPETFKNKFRK